MTSATPRPSAPPLAPGFLRRPLAHRGLHGPARPENSRAAVRAAIAAGYGVEIDVQLSRDGCAMVFHDADLGRLTGATGAVAARDAAALAALTLHCAPAGAAPEAIPTLADMLDLVGGQVPLLIELKDQGDEARTVALADDVARLLAGYPGAPDWVAVMSFSPGAVAAVARAAPAVPRGLTTCAWGADMAPGLDAATRARLRAISDFDAVGASFVSHEAVDLGRPRLAELRARGVPVLCWTIRTPEAEAEARHLAQNITFEGYLPEHPFR